MFNSGDVLGDRYRLDDRVGAGGMGEVWQATDTVLGRRVAVKVLHPRRAGDPEFQNRFRHEALAMAALHHPGVAGVYDYGEIGDGDGAYIVMVYIDGQPLDERIADGKRLDPATTISIVAQAARALHAAHAAGIVHRDVKPGNMIIQPDGAVVLVDFGVARSADSTTLTGVNQVIGTALYIAPEQVSKQTTGPGTDIYALGAVAYHCLAGHPPFPGDNPVAVAIHHLSDDPPPLPADVPSPVRDLVSTAMAKDPADRYPTAAAMAAAAEALVPTADWLVPAADTAAGEAEPGGVPAAAGPARRPRRAAAAWALVLLALAALGVVLALAGPDDLVPSPVSPPVTPDSQPAGSAGIGQGGDSGAPAPGRPGTTGQPGPTSTVAGASPANPAPGPTTSPTPPGGPASTPAPSVTTGPAQSATTNPEPTGTGLQATPTPTAAG